MLSQVRSRLLHRSFVTGNFLDSAFIVPSVARFSSKNDDEHDDLFSLAGVSKPAKRLLTPAPDSVVKNLTKLSVSPEHGNAEFFDQVINKTSVSFKAGRKIKEELKKQTLKKQPTKMKTSKFNDELVNAVLNVASHAGKSKKQVQDDLFAKLGETSVTMNHPKKKHRKIGNKKELGMDLISEIPDNFDANFSEKQRKPYTSKAADNESAGTQSENPDEFVDLAFKKGFRKEGSYDRRLAFQSIDQFLESETPLGIFPTNMEVKGGDSLKMWHAFEMTEVRRSTRFEPLNWFDQCIQWTEDGKLWHFPINNEQGMEEEAEIDFTEHIFLDHHIESWCPKDGPIRCFMELVTVGLSKNPYLSVQEKKKTLEWYHQYFTKHHALLEEINAFGSANNPIPVEGKLS